MCVRVSVWVWLPDWAEVAVRYVCIWFPFALQSSCRAIPFSNHTSIAATHTHTQTHTHKVWWANSSHPYRDRVDFSHAVANIWQTHVHQNAPSQAQLRRAKAPGRRLSQRQRQRLSSRLRLVFGALRVYLGDATLCVSTPFGHCLLAALAARLPASFV